MHPTIKDPDFTFEAAAHRRAMSHRVREEVEDHRRRRVQVGDPNAKRVPAWKVRDANKPLPPEWEFTRDKDGKVTLAKQMRKHPNSMDLDPRFLGRRYVSEITGDPCAIGGQHCEKGCKVDSYADAALGIHGTRGRILEEYQET